MWPARELPSDEVLDPLEVLDLLAERSRDEAGQLRLTGEDLKLGKLV